MFLKLIKTTRIEAKENNNFLFKILREFLKRAGCTIEYLKTILFTLLGKIGDQPLQFYDLPYSLL